MRNEVGMINWQAEFGEKGATDCWLIFKEILTNSINKNVPTITVGGNISQKWLNRDIVKMVRKKKRFWKEYRLTGTTGTAVARERYEEIEKALKKTIKKKQKEDRRGNWRKRMTETEKNLQTTSNPRQRQKQE
jgi:hypothetical protein